MSRGPYWMPAARWGARMGETTIVDPVQGALTDPFHSILMGVTAENLAERDGISRERQDEFAVESHRRAAAAREAGRFDDEIVPVRGARQARDRGVHPRRAHPRGRLDRGRWASSRRSSRHDGTVTAGNASGMNDAGAAVVLLSQEKAEELGAQVRARVLAYASCGVDPQVMGIGPVPAVEKVLDRAGVSLDDIGVIELNEAFAAQALAVIDDLGSIPRRSTPTAARSRSATRSPPPDRRSPPRPWPRWSARTTSSAS